MTDNSDTLKVSGKLTLILRDDQGNIKQEMNVNNVVVNDGKEFIASRMGGTSFGVMSHMAVGTSGSGAVPGDSQLVDEVGEIGSPERASVSTSITGSPVANTVSYTATFGPGVGTGSLLEAGIFNSSAFEDGTMLCRTTFASISKGASDSLTINWNITIS